MTDKICVNCKHHKLLPERGVYDAHKEKIFILEQHACK